MAYLLRKFLTNRRCRQSEDALQRVDYIYAIPRASQREQRPIEELRVTARASYSDFEIVRYESGAIRIVRDGIVQPVVVKDVLRPIAAEIGVEVLDGQGEIKNTRSLGADVIRALNARGEGLA